MGSAMVKRLAITLTVVFVLVPLGHQAGDASGVNHSLAIAP